MKQVFNACVTPVLVVTCVHPADTSSAFQPGEKSFTKIKVKNAIVDLDGDEMTRYCKSCVDCLAQLSFGEVHAWSHNAPPRSDCTFHCGLRPDSLVIRKHGSAWSDARWLSDRRVIWDDIKKKVLLT